MGVGRGWGVDTGGSALERAEAEVEETEARLVRVPAAAWAGLHWTA